MSEDYRNSRNLAFRKLLPLLAIVLSLGIALAGCSSQPSSNQEWCLRSESCLSSTLCRCGGARRDITESGTRCGASAVPQRSGARFSLRGGQVDGVLNDPVAAALLNKDGEKAKIVRLAFKGNPSMA